MGRADQTSLSDTLAQIRRDKAAGKRPKKKPTRFGKIGQSEYIVNAKGERLERPTIYGLNWLRLAGEALKLHEVVWDCRVSTERWEIDGCVSLHLQRVVHAENAPTAVTVGGKGLVITRQTAPVMGGAWEHWRIPIGLVNNHDLRGLLRQVMAPKADLVIADNRLLRAINGR